MSKIDSKAPTGFILDISLLMSTIDAEERLSPFSWQYVVEQDLINQGGLNIVTSVELYPSLIKEVSLIYFLQRLEKFSVINCVPGELLLHLRKFEVKVQMNGCALLLAVNNELANTESRR